MWHWQTLSSSPRFRNEAIVTRWLVGAVLGWFVTGFCSYHWIMKAPISDDVNEWRTARGWLFHQPERTLTLTRAHIFSQHVLLAILLLLHLSHKTCQLWPGWSRTPVGQPMSRSVSLRDCWHVPSETPVGWLEIYLVEKSSSHEWTMSSSWIMSIKQSIQRAFHGFAQFPFFLPKL